MNEAEALEQEIIRQEQSKRLTITECMSCGNKQFLYLCEQGHGKVFCKECVSTAKFMLIKDVEGYGSIGNKVNIGRCLPFNPPFKDCNYNPIFTYGQQTKTFNAN